MTGPTPRDRPRFHDNPGWLEELRARVREKMNACPTCGHPRVSLRGTAKEMGVPATVLLRFLAGLDVRGHTLDKIDAYLGTGWKA